MYLSSLFQSRTDTESSFNSRKETLPKPITIVTSESSSTSFVHPPASEDLSYRMKHSVTAPTPAMVRAHIAQCCVMLVIYI